MLNSELKSTTKGNSSPRYSGVRVTVEELRGLRGHAVGVGNTPAEALAGLFPGAFRSRFFGRGLDFHEVRAYQPGDDFRGLDWRVTARTGELHTKVFHEERERILHVLIDAGPAMHFGSRRAFKWVAAARLAALVAWLAVENGERVAGLLFGGGHRCPFRPPAAGEPGALTLFALWAEVTRRPGPETAGCGLAAALARLRHLARPGALVLILSDFAGLDAQARSLLHRLARHHSLAGVLVHDPLEVELPPPGLYPVSDGRRVRLLDSADRRLGRELRERALRHRRQVAGVFRGLGARSLSLSTDQAPEQCLRTAVLEATRRGA